MSERSDFRHALLAWWDDAIAAGRALPPDELAALQQWEKENLDGHSIGTDDWPGWRRYLRPMPVWGDSVPVFKRTHGVSKKTPVPFNLRWAVWERDDFTCRQCGARHDLAADHIIPESAGGATTLENLQTLCRSCNSIKGRRHGPSQLNLLTAARRIARI